MLILCHHSKNSSFVLFFLFSFLLSRRDGNKVTHSYICLGVVALFINIVSNSGHHCEHWAVFWTLFCLFDSYQFFPSKQDFLFLFSLLICFIGKSGHVTSSVDI